LDRTKARNKIPEPTDNSSNNTLFNKHEHKYHCKINAVVEKLGKIRTRVNTGNQSSHKEDLKLIATSLVLDKSTTNINSTTDANVDV
jgi:hypothetical protein